MRQMTCENSKEPLNTTFDNMHAAAPTSVPAWAWGHVTFTLGTNVFLLSYLATLKDFPFLLYIGLRLARQL